MEGVQYVSQFKIETNTIKYLVSQQHGFQTWSRIVKQEFKLQTLTDTAQCLKKKDSVCQLGILCDQQFHYTGLFKMIVGVLTTCHTQYT
jgi:hypothetical protein